MDVVVEVVDGLGGGTFCELGCFCKVCCSLGGGDCKPEE